MKRVTLLLCLIAAQGLAQEASLGSGATIRLLDKVTGQLEDIEMSVGQTARLGQVDIDLAECRYPTGNPSGDAYAYLQIEDRTAEIEIFAGWMIASSPALNALDHPRYDVWVIRCKTS
ncbi:MAG: DUF2155 domain-containing protein [Pseudomonadota bacterium]